VEAAAQKFFPALRSLHQSSTTSAVVVETALAEHGEKLDQPKVAVQRKVGWSRPNG
jgi:hypothetical protein